MQIGVSVPITDFGADFGAVRDYVQAAEDLGYGHIRTLDHVLGADPQHHPEVPRFPYTHESYICLLYTSPSPRDLSTSRMPSSA